MVRKMDGIKAGYNFFIMLPGMNLRDLMKTLILYFRLPILLFPKGGGSLLGWIRIEPNTKIHEWAIKEGIVSKDTNLLPEDERELKKLFYTNPSFRYIDFFILFLVKFMENIVKPVAKFVIKSLFKR